jgi:hypothetical protein
MWHIYSFAGGPRHALIMAKTAKAMKTKPINVSIMLIGGGILSSGEAEISLGCSINNMKKTIIITLCQQFLCLLACSHEKENVIGHKYM